LSDEIGIKTGYALQLVEMKQRTKCSSMHKYEIYLRIRKKMELLQLLSRCLIQQKGISQKTSYVLERILIRRLYRWCHCIAFYQWLQPKRDGLRKQQRDLYKLKDEADQYGQVKIYFPGVLHFFIG
jgi:hypothetical protein